MMKYSISLLLLSILTIYSTSSSLYSDVKLESSELIYIPSPFPMDYTAGLNFCTELNAILAEPRTESEIELIDDDLDVNSHYWIGM